MVELHAGYNDLTALGSELRSMTALQSLHLEHNALTKLPAELGGLRNLKVLDITHNRIAALPPPLGAIKLESFEVGDQQGCLRSPPKDVVAMGTSSILSFLEQLLRGQQPCFRMKLMFVGQENVGYAATQHVKPHAIASLHLTWSFTTAKRRSLER
jgi:Leucine-rich repeat (LRR) protein